MTGTFPEKISPVVVFFGVAISSVVFDADLMGVNAEI